MKYASLLEQIVQEFATDNTVLQICNRPVRITDAIFFAASGSHICIHLA